MLVEQRRNRLLQTVRAKGFASLQELTETLQVSEATVRRDLRHLESSGAARRTHGGVFYTGPAPQLPHFEERQPAQWEKKTQIARLAAKLIDDGDTVLLDGGSTTYEVARLLLGRPLQIVTNSLPVANLFATSGGVDLVLVGGYVYPRTGVALGPHADSMLKNLSVRRTVLSIAGATERGFFNSNSLLVETERTMMQAADEVIVVADSSKFGRQSLARLCDLGEVQHLVADDQLAADWRTRLETAGVKLHLAAPSDAENPSSGESASGTT